MNSGHNNVVYTYTCVCIHVLRVKSAIQRQYFIWEVAILSSSALGTLQTDDLSMSVLEILYYMCIY